MRRKHIKPGTRLAVRMSVRERDLVVGKAFLDPEIEATLREATEVGSKLVVDLNLDDIDDLLGCATTAKCGVCSMRSPIGSASFWTN